MPIYSSKQWCNLIQLLNMTVNYSYANNIVLFWFPIHAKDIYRVFTGGKHSLKANLPVPTTFNFANISWISLDAYFDHDLGHGMLQMIHWLGKLWRTAWIRAMLGGGGSVMAGLLLLDGLLGNSTRQKDISVWAMMVTLSLLSESAASNHHTGVLAHG